jgi:hypothetical protein
MTRDPKRARLILWCGTAAIILFLGVLVWQQRCPGLLALERLGVGQSVELFSTVPGVARCWLVFAWWAGLALVMASVFELTIWWRSRWPEIPTPIPFIASGVALLGVWLVIRGKEGSFVFLIGGAAELLIGVVFLTRPNWVRVQK